MGRAPCCEKIGLKKGRWTAEEDNILTKYIQAHGEGSWRSLPKNAGLLRCGKSCRLRWVNYLKSDLKRGKFSSDEDETIIKLHASLGNRWCLIAGHLPGRTDNEIKNYWNSHLSRRIYNFRKIIQQVQQQKVKATVDNQPKPKITETTTSKRKGKTSRSAMKKNKSYIPPNLETVPIPATPALEENLMVVDGIFSDSAFTSLVELEVGSDSKLQGNQDINDIQNWLMDAKSTEEDHVQGSKVMSSISSDGENSYPNHELDILEWDWGNLDMNEGKEIWEWESEEEKLLLCGLWGSTLG